MAVPDTLVVRLGPAHVPAMVVLTSDLKYVKKVPATGGEASLKLSDRSDCMIRASPGDGVVGVPTDRDPDGDLVPSGHSPKSPGEDSDKSLR